MRQRAGEICILKTAATRRPGAGPGRRIGGSFISVAEGSAYLGAALTAIDPKGRMAIPATFRNPLIKSSGGERIVCIARNAHAPCLQCYGLGRRDELFEQVRRREQVAIERGDEFRSEHVGGPLFGMAFEVSFDASGRLILPSMLRMSANIGDKAFFSGNGFDFSIWNPEVLFAQEDPRLESQKFAAKWLLDEYDGKAK